MKRIAKRIFCLLSALLFTNLSFAQDTTKVVIDWLKQNSIPIKYIEAGNGFSDLQPLKKLWKDVKVIGLGEATHGTREFFQMKYRLLEFLVTELGFTDFILESSYSACQSINDYILPGQGDRATVLTGQGYTAWDTEEFSAIIDWMRAYNEKVPDEKKIRFHGMDLCFNGVGRDVVLNFLRQYAPDKVAATDSLFQILATEEAKWPRRLNQSTLQSTFMPLQSLGAFFTKNKEKLISAASAKKWEKAFKYTKVMEHWVEANIQDTTLSFLPKPKQGRDEYMIENVRNLLDKAELNTKFMVWAHHSHIAANNSFGVGIGSYLKERLGNSYYALDLDCNEGTFRSRIVLPDGRFGELTADTIPSGPEQSLSWYLSQVDKSPLFVDLGSIQANPIVSKWLEKPKEITWAGWGYGTDKDNKPTPNHQNVLIKGYFDGVLFVERSTPTRPTKNALERSTNKIGF
ncbi:MAG: erythromycin esterase family protein [Ferruginibacter sp.]